MESLRDKICDESIKQLGNGPNDLSVLVGEALFYQGWRLVLFSISFT